MNNNTNFSDRKWVLNALSFWEGTTPKQCGKSRKLINWNIEMLIAILKRLDA